MRNSEEVKGIRFYRANSDMYGNPRYIVHFPEFLTDNENETLSINERYNLAHKRAKQIGFYKYRGRDFGGGFVGKSYSLFHTAKLIQELRGRI